MTNVNGNVFGGQSKSKALTLVKGKRGRLKTHNIPRVKKGIAKRQKGLKFPQYRQFNKRGRKII